MKLLFSLFIMSIVVLLGCMVNAAEEEVWYDASGKIVRVTPLEKPKAPFIPAWQKRDAAQRARSYDGVQRTRSGYWYPYSRYYYAGHHRFGGRRGYRSYCRPSYSRRGHAGSRLHGSYRKNGWSVRIRF